MTLLSRFTLRTILTTSFLVFALAPLGVVGVSTWKSANMAAEEKISAYLTNAKALADKIDRNLFERYGDVQAFGLNQVVRDKESWYQPGDDNPIVQAMNSYVDTYDIYYLTMLVDPDGNLIAVNSKDQDGRSIESSGLYKIDFSGEDWLADCKRGRFYESEDRSITGTVVEHLYVDDYAREAYGDEGLALGFSAPVFDGDGEIIAYWKNVAKFSLVEDIVLAGYLDLKEAGSPSTEITLLDKKGNVIIDCDPTSTGEEAIIRDLSVIGKFNLAEKQVEAAVNVVAGNAGTIARSWHARKEIDQVAAFTPLTGALGFPGMEWNVLVRVARAEAMAVSEQAKTIVLTTVGITAFVVSILAFWFSRSISKVLWQAISSMESAEKGDFSRKVKGSLSQDLVRLSATWNELLKTLSTAGAESEEASKLRDVVDSSQYATMMVDRDLTVTYLNDASVEIVTKHQDAFRKIWPNFDPTNLMGACIDQFHTNPQYQRQILANPQNLPHQADIHVGGLILSLHITATHGRDGEYIGNTLVWADVTEKRELERRNADFTGQIEAISKSYAVIEFDTEGNILTANDIFQSALEYSLDELQGKHHRIFVDPEYARSPEYKELWATLNRGTYVSGEFLRFSKTGKEIWIQASYNPIFDLDGNIAKVVKYASDITATKQMQKEVEEARQKEQRNAEEQEAKVGDLLRVVNQVADGDLAVTMPDLGSDAIGQVAEGVGKAVESIRQTLVQVQDVATTVASSANEMSSASEQISNGAQQQASSLEETAASLEEITSAVKQNTDNSQQAQQLSMSSREIAESGGAVVGDAVDAMTAINNSSKKIAEIITTIDEIAFQTNLLALNAAVEAARAGEQGRGFAVVASEVRNLAQRSAGAAKEIKNLIQDSVAKVENGTELVNKSGDTLQEIVTSVKRVADIVTEISAASTEQLTGIEQVNSAVSQMDRVTQTNAAQTEEMTGNSQSLLSNSDNLRRLVSSFQLGAGSSSGMPQEARPAPATQSPATNSWDTPAASHDTAHELDLIGVGADEFDEF